MEENNKKKIDWYKWYAIFGVLLLIVVVVGATYAFYIARRTAVFSGTTAGYAKLEVNLVSVNTDKKLIPIEDTATNLTQKALGWNGTSYNNVFNQNTACVDKSNGYSACQIYEVKIINKTDNDFTVNIGVTSLVGASAPNIDVVKMASKDSVTNNTSIKGNASGIASNLVVNAGTTSSSYYILVFVRNNPNGQTDTGTFTGVVTAQTVSGPALSDEGIVTAEF